MGSKFFQKASPITAGGNTNMMGRAINSGAYQGRIAGGGANKDISQAVSLYKQHGFKPEQRGAAYPKGPKI